MNRSLVSTLILSLAGAALLSGCETIKPAVGVKPAGSASAAPAAATGKAGPGAGAATAQPMPATSTPEQIGLRDGIELYNKGAFNDAIKRLSMADVTAGSRATQLAALKYSAFSYCVTRRQSQCRQAFEKAFKLDPAFTLAPGEHGHPLWGPAFALVRKSAR